MVMPYPWFTTGLSYLSALELKSGVVHRWGMDMPPQQPMASGKNEPMFNIPFVPLVVGLGLVALYWAQNSLPDGGMSLALRPIDIESGHLAGLVTHIAVHGGWTHVIMNAIGTIAFGAPVARDLVRGLGAIAWVLFYILCGVIGGLGYTLLNGGDVVPVVGASGAVFGLIGASLRLIAGPGLLIPLFHPLVLRSAAAWLVATIVLGLLSGLFVGEGARIAWEAHLFGFLAGITLIGPFHRLFGMKRPAILG